MATDPTTDPNILKGPQVDAPSGKPLETAVTSNISDETSGSFKLLQSAYSERVAYGLREGGGAKILAGTSSIFNPFNVFRYSKFGSADDYDPKLHIDSSTGSSDFLKFKEQEGTAISLLASKEGTPETIANYSKTFNDRVKSFSEHQEFIENPSASNIIKWANSTTSGASNVPIAPYSITDFLWCTHYGKIPNNRLLTLRRYPIPVEDNLAIHSSKMPLVPIAQAVSWFGKETENPLSNILGFNWGFNWQEIKFGDVKDITGNEIRVDELLALFKLTDEKSTKLANILRSFWATDSQDIQALLGNDVKAQEYMKGSYGPEGPYWNRVLGPVNVVEQTNMRTRGFPMQKPIVLNFKYSLRSWNNINPKIAFLDLLSNFLSLTYNTAPFWQGGYRYFKRTGLTVSSLPGLEKLMNGDVIGAGQEALTNLSAVMKEQGQAFLDTIVKLLSGKITTTDDEIKKLEEDIGIKTNALFATAAGKVIPTPLLIRGMLDGRAVGEWHVTVGNPMNPIAVIGNLCLDSVLMEVNDELGIDDFPTEVSFKVTLKHGRGRAKQDIERMFNYGNGPMSFTELASPSSAKNSNGEANSNQINEANSGSSNTQAGLTAEQQSLLNAKVDNARTRVRDFYGNAFAESQILPSYFKEIKTKD